MHGVAKWRGFQVVRGFGVCDARLADPLSKLTAHAKLPPTTHHGTLQIVVLGDRQAVTGHLGTGRLRW
jgi:hypothetical protein